MNPKPYASNFSVSTSRGKQWDTLGRSVRTAIFVVVWDSVGKILVYLFLACYCSRGSKKTSSFAFIALSEKINGQTAKNGVVLDTTSNVQPI